MIQTISVASDVIPLPFPLQEVLAEQQIVRRHGVSGAGFEYVVDAHTTAFDIFAGLAF